MDIERRHDPKRGTLAIVEDDLRRLAVQQDNVLRRSQLRDFGIDRWRVRAEVRARRWTPIGGTVVVLHNGPLTQVQREWAAVFATGRGAALAGRTSLARAGLRSWQKTLSTS